MTVNNNIANNFFHEKDIRLVEERIEALKDLLNLEILDNEYFS